MRTILKDWYWRSGGAASNNAYVQAWYDKGQTEGYSLPDQSLLNALSFFFNSIDDKMSLIEMIKIYALNDASLGSIATLNFKDPLLYQSTLVNSPTYGIKGYISNGTTSYVNGQIATNRRVIKGDFSSSVYGMDKVAVTLKTLYGSNVSGGFFIVRPGGPFVANCYPFNGSTSITSVDANAMFSLYSVSPTESRVSRNSLQGSIVTQATAGVSQTIYDCCQADGATPKNFHNTCHVGLRIEGFQMTNVQLEEIRAAFEIYLTAIGL